MHTATGLYIRLQAYAYAYRLIHTPAGSYAVHTPLHTPTGSYAIHTPTGSAGTPQGNSAVALSIAAGVSVKPAGTQFTCFTGTKVQILQGNSAVALSVAAGVSVKPAGTQFTCFTGTKVQLLTLQAAWQSGARISRLKIRTRARI